MTWRIRRAVRSDQETICALWWALMEEQMAQDSELRMAPDARERWCNGFSSDVRSPVHCFCVAEQAGEIIGFAHAYLLYPPPLYAQELEAFIAEVYVRPGWRGQGVGRALVAYVRTWAEGERVRRLRLEVLARNTRSLYFWEREGFRPFSVVAIRPCGGNPEENDGVEGMRGK